MPVISSPGLDLVVLAYNKLKQDVYNEKSLLFLRKRIAVFETASDFEARLSAVLKVINSTQGAKSPQFQEWLTSIAYKILPKAIKELDADQADGRFITNVTTQEKYEITKVNYFFDGPVELHIIAVLWVMVEGWLLDKDLSRDCYGSRLHKSISAKRGKGRQLFRDYPTVYAAWRDKAIKCAENLLSSEHQSVCILSLDIQEFFYRIPFDFGTLHHFLEKRKNECRHTDALARRQEAPRCLRSMVEAISKAYWAAAKPSLAASHNINEQKAGFARRGSSRLCRPCEPENSFFYFYLLHFNLFWLVTIDLLKRGFRLREGLKGI
jgi:hypothetical protein